MKPLSSVQFSSVIKSCPTLCDPTDCSIPGFLFLHYLPEFAQTYVHWISNAIQPSHPLLHPFSLFPSIFPSISGFSNELALRIRWPEQWRFGFSVSPSNKYSAFISFKIDWFDYLAVQGTLKIFFMVKFSHPYMIAEKTIALTIHTFVSKGKSLLYFFN